MWESWKGSTDSSRSTTILLLIALINIFNYQRSNWGQFLERLGLSITCTTSFSRNQSFLKILSCFNNWSLIKFVSLSKSSLHLKAQTSLAAPRGHLWMIAVGSQKRYNVQCHKISKTSCLAITISYTSKLSVSSSSIHKWGSKIGTTYSIFEVKSGIPSTLIFCSRNRLGICPFIAWIGWVFAWISWVIAWTGWVIACTRSNWVEFHFPNLQCSVCQQTTDSLLSIMSPRKITIHSQLRQISHFISIIFFVLFFIKFSQITF